MASVLTGSSRAVIRYMTAELPALIRLSIVPMLILAAVFAGGFYFLFGRMREMAGLVSTSEIDPRIVNEIVLIQGIGFALQIVAGAVMSYVFVLIVRHYLPDWRPAAKTLNGPVMSAFMVMIYAIGVSLLTALVLVIPMILAIAASASAIAVVSYGGPNPFNAGIATLVVGGAILGVLFLGFWFVARFLAGFAEVALGGTPDFFSGLWPLARGTSWALPWRLFWSYLAMMLIVLPVQAFTVWRAAQGFAPIGAEPSPAEIFEMQGKILGSLLWISPVYAAVSYLYLIFISLLLAEAYKRFKAPAGR